MTGTQKPENVLTKQQRIAELSEQFAQRSFTSLSHYIDREWLRDAILIELVKMALLVSMVRRQWIMKPTW
jgi:hypothetical protein